MYFHKPQEKPRRWGSFQDVQYAIMKNCEKIYGIDPDSIILAMPLFWGLPPLDYSGYNNHGTNHGAIYKDGSLNFDGDDYVKIDNGAVVTAVPLTISAWVKLDDIGSGHEVLSISSNAIDHFFRLLYAAGNTAFQATTKDGTTANSAICTTNPVAGTWYHVVAVFSAIDNRKIYVDGVLENTETTARTPSNLNRTNIGVVHNGASLNLYMNGMISEAHISNVARTKKQIALFHDRPWDLYRPVSKPVYSLPAVGVTIPVFMQNMRGGFNPISRGGFIN